MMTFKEWCEGRHNSVRRKFSNSLVEEYDDGDILHFWYLCNQDSPAVKRFILGLNDLMDECFPNEHKCTESKESEHSSLLHRYILVSHGDEQ